MDPSKNSVDAPIRRRGAPRHGEPTARERILATANQLFYREGIRSIGIDTVIAESGVAKASLYRNFDSKDALVEAVLEARDQSFWRWWESIASKQTDDPRALLDAILIGVAERVGNPSFYGCPFLNISSEFRDEDHPGRRVARRNKEELRARLAEICAAIGTADPDRTSAQLFLLINGAYSIGASMVDTDLQANLLDAASRIVR